MPKSTKPGKQKVLHNSFFKFFQQMSANFEGYEMRSTDFLSRLESRVTCFTAEISVFDHKMLQLVLLEK